MHEMKRVLRRQQHDARTDDDEEEEVILILILIRRRRSNLRGCLAEQLALRLRLRQQVARCIPRSVGLRWWFRFEGELPRVTFSSGSVGLPPRSRVFSNLAQAAVHSL
jgi:hypothetical protein